MIDYDPQRDATIEDVVTRVKRMFQGGKVDPSEAEALLIELQKLAPEQLAMSFDRLRVEYGSAPGDESAPADSDRDCCWCSHYEEADDHSQFRCLFDDQLHPATDTIRAHRCLHWLYPFGDVEG